MATNESSSNNLVTQGNNSGGNSFTGNMGGGSGNNSNDLTSQLRQSPFGRLFDLPGVDGPEDIFGNLGSPSGGSNPFGGGGGSPMMGGGGDSPYGGNPFAGDNFWNIFAGGVNPTNPSGGGNTAGNSGGNPFTGGGNPFAGGRNTSGNSGGNPFTGGGSNSLAANNATIGRYNQDLSTNNATIGNGNWLLGTNNATIGNGNWNFGKNNQVIGNGNWIFTDNNTVFGNGNWVLGADNPIINPDDVINSTPEVFAPKIADNIHNLVDSVMGKIGKDFVDLTGNFSPGQMQTYNQLMLSKDSANKGSNPPASQPKDIPEPTSAVSLVILGIGSLLWLRCKKRLGMANS